jgi:hypothetical protein
VSAEIAGWAKGLQAICSDVFLMRYVAPFGIVIVLAVQLWN